MTIRRLRLRCRCVQYKPWDTWDCILSTLNCPWIPQTTLHKCNTYNARMLVGEWKASSTGHTGAAHSKHRMPLLYTKRDCIRKEAMQHTANTHLKAESSFLRTPSTDIFSTLATSVSDWGSPVNRPYRRARTSPSLWGNNSSTPSTSLANCLWHKRHHIQQKAGWQIWKGTTLATSLANCLYRTRQRLQKK